MLKVLLWIYAASGSTYVGLLLSGNHVVVQSAHVWMLAVAASAPPALLVLLGAKAGRRLNRVFEIDRHAKHSRQ